MQCPFCSHIEDKVIDSRLSKEGDVVRRRRECFGCKRRFTTYERVGEIFPMVVKKDGRREPFDREKIFNGLKRACEKRPVSMDILSEVVTCIEKKVQEMEGSEIKSVLIGEEVISALQDIDPVAYVRFASVYKEFKDIGEFMSEIKSLGMG
ncbi:MAG: transcriptional regulator NrdR [Nitrospirota bacterium]